MKYIVKIAAVCTFLMITSIALATEPNPSILTDVASKSLMLKLDTKDQKTSLKLMNSTNEVLYFEQIDAIKYYRKKFNFSKLKKGDYSLIVENALSVTVHAFTVTEDTIEMSLATKNNKPFFKVIAERIGFNYLNATEDTVVVSVYDDENRVVFSEEFTDVVLQKTFNFEKAYPGTYRVIIKTKGKLYSKNVLIK